MTAAHHAYERCLLQSAQDLADALLQHPDWKENATVLRDRADAIIDRRITEHTKGQT